MVGDLGRSGWLEKLSHAELIVWLQLIRWSETESSRMTIRNEDLHRTPRMAQRALIGLKRHGLIHIEYSGGRRLGERTLVLR